jgi:hypothetical protein
MRSRTIRLLALAGAFTLATAASSAAGMFTRSSLQDVSVPSPFADCAISGVAAGGTNFLNSEVEPWVEVNPTNPMNVVAVWQQDRWSNGGARGLLTAFTHDGGATWDTTFPHFSTCAGGTPANGGNYERSSDPWVTFSPNGDAYQISLSVNFVNDPATAVLVSKSTDGGDTWSEPTTLVRDPSAEAPFLFNDKESITADPNNSRYAYAIWDRTRFPSDSANFNAQHAFSFRGDAIFSRTTDGGRTWDTRAIFVPQELKATIGHQIVVEPRGVAEHKGDLIDLFTLFQGSGMNQPGSSLAMMRSTDKGATWSAPQVIHKIQFDGAFDPDTGRAIRAEGFVPEVAVDPHNGNLYATWQDIRFSGVDQIAFSMSTDGGDTWSKPIKVSQTPSSADPANEQAWVPAVDVADDGTIAVTYYDFRRNTSAPGVPTDHWMVHCHPSDTTTCAEADDWGDELRLTDSSFDVEKLPFARGPFGYFVGEYEGLSSTGNTFRPLFAVGLDDLANRTTDILTATTAPKP